MCCGLVLLAAGCAATPSTPGAVADPLEPMNRAFYAFNSHTDRLVVAPIARVYKKITPKPLRGSFTNFFRNAAYPNVIVNDFLQGRIHQGAEDIGRFMVNSTVGVFGIFNIASRIGLKSHTEDAGITLARWGVGRGYYLVLPFIGPDTTRNLPSLALSIVTNVLFYVGNAAVTIPLTVLEVINTRANASRDLRYVRQNAVDKYIFVRNAYIQHRNALIYGSKLPLKAVENLMMLPNTGASSRSGTSEKPKDPPPPFFRGKTHRMVHNVRPPIPYG